MFALTAAQLAERYIEVFSQSTPDRRKNMMVCGPIHCHAFMLTRPPWRVQDCFASDVQVMSLQTEVPFVNNGQELAELFRAIPRVSLPHALIVFVWHEGLPEEEGGEGGGGGGGGEGGEGEKKSRRRRRRRRRKKKKKKKRETRVALRERQIPSISVTRMEVWAVGLSLSLSLSPSLPPSLQVRSELSE